MDRACFARSVRAPIGLAVAALACTHALAAAQSIKLNTPFPGAVLGDIQSFRFSPDGTYVVYSADQDTDDVFELYSFERGASAPVKLNAPLVAGGDVLSFLDAPAEYEISPDSTRVVYVADQDLDARYEVYSVPIDGGTPVKLNPAGVNVEGPDAVQISPDGARVVFTGNGSGAVHVYSSPITGLSVIDLGTGDDPVIGPDSNRVAFRRFVGGASELRSDLLTGGSPALLALSHTLDRLLFGPNSQRVVYIGRATSTGHRRLHSVAAAGGQAEVELSGTLATTREVNTSPKITADSQWVIYTVDRDVAGSYQIFRAPIDGSAAPVELGGSLTAGGSIGGTSDSEFGVSPNGQHVVYRADQEVDERFELFRVRVDASAAPVKLNGSLAAGGDVETAFVIAPDSTSVVYLADELADERWELFRAPLGAGTTQPLCGPIAANADVFAGFQIAAGRVAYLADQAIDGTIDLFTVPLAGGTPVKVNQLLVTSGHVLAGFAIESTGERIAYRADAVENERFELFEADADGGGSVVRVSGPILAGDVRSDVAGFTLFGSRVLYVADQATNDLQESWSVSARGGEVPVSLGFAEPTVGSFSGTDLQVGADGRWLVQREIRELRSAPTDGSQAPRVLSAPGQFPQDDWTISPDGARVVYRSDEDTVSELFSVPVDGSTPPVALNAALVAGGDVQRFHVSPDSTRVVYVADQDEDSRYELFSVAIEGGAPPVQLHPALPSFTDVDVFGPVEPFLIDPTGTWVVYVADQQVDQKIELYRVPILGGAPLKLNHALSAIEDVGGVDAKAFEIGADGVDVVYVATDGLYRVPLDGSSTAVLLSSAYDASGSLNTFRIDPTSSRVVYSTPTGPRKLFSVALDGGAPIELSGPLVPGSDVQPDFLVSPDGARVVYRADEVANVFDLFSVPIDGSAPATRLDDTSPTADVESAFLVDSGSRWVVFRHDPVDGVAELFRAPLDGGSAAVRVSGPMQPLGDVQVGFRITAGGNRVVYRADQDTDQTFELYSSELSGPPATRSGPSRHATLPTNSIGRNP